MAGLPLVEVMSIGAIMSRCRGWCDLRKGVDLASLIANNDIMISVEIGVYNGQSLLPQAYAHKAKNLGGKAYGIDPWSASEALQDDAIHMAPHWNKWAEQDVNFQALYESTSGLISEFGLQNHCEIIRSKSENALDSFEDDSIGLLHIDGNHDYPKVKKDFDLYYKKVRPGGFIWFDDLYWPGPKRATDEMLATPNLLMSAEEKYSGIDLNLLVRKRLG